MTKIKKVKMWALLGHTGKISPSFDGMPAIYFDEYDAEINRFGNQKVVPVEIKIINPMKRSVKNKKE